MPTDVGKRYSCATCESEILVVKGGEGDIECCDAVMAYMEPKPLPSSD